MKLDSARFAISNTPMVWKILLVFIPSAIAVSVAVILIINRAESSLTDWPPFTMVYQRDGAAVSVGDKSQTLVEVHRLEYRSHNNWTDTIIESPDVETSLGTFSWVGSYRSLDGSIDTEYDATTDFTSSERLDGDAIHLPGGACVPFQLQSFESVDIKPTIENTNTLVCFKDDCLQNADGRRYDYRNGEYVFADDSRGIPIRVGDHFVALELRVNDVKR